jgi:hypothetical protein
LAIEMLTAEPACGSRSAESDDFGSANVVVACSRVSRQSPPVADPQTRPAGNQTERHLVIAGTGRSGTSFLVRYLTALGLDTTLARKGDAAGWDSEANAGLENMMLDPCDRNLPYVIKSPWISEYVEQMLTEKRLKIDAFIVPVRDLVEAATSRVVLERRAIHQHNPWMAEELDRSWETFGHTPGGLVYSLNPLDQARLLAVQFHRLVLKVAEAGIPLVFPVFPKIAMDWEYLHKCLQSVLPAQITEEMARSAHASVADASKVRVTVEISKGAASPTPLRRELQAGPRYPSLAEVDNIALRREIGRLREELSACAALQLEAKISELHAAKLELEHERADLRRKLSRRSIKYKMTRLLRLVGGPQALEA